MTDYKALYEAQVEENEDTLASLNFYQEANKELKEERKTLKQENSILRDLIQNKLPVGCIAETTYQPILDENEKLKNEIDELQMNHIDMKCEISGTTLTEDDLQMSLEIGRLICESAYDDLPAEDKKTREELKKEIKEIKKKCMKSISKLGKEKKDLKKQLESSE